MAPPPKSGHATPELLAALAVGTSGCLGPTSGAVAGDDLTGTASPTPRPVRERTSPGPTATPPESPFPRWVAVESVADGPLREAFGVAAELSVPDDEVTPAGTATVELALRATEGAGRSLTYEKPRCGRNEFRARTGDFKLFLFPAGGEWTVEDSDCPVVSYPNLNCGIPVVEETVTVPASGALTWRYEVVVLPKNLDRGGCVMPGQFRFGRSFGGAAGTATLTFALSVTK